MSTTELTPVRPASITARLSHLAAAGFASIRTMVVALRNRGTVTKLLELDDRMLNDIGLTRADVYSSLSRPIEEDPSLHLSAFWSERNSALRASAKQRLRDQVRRMEF